MNRAEYLAAHRHIENMSGLSPENVTGTLAFLDKQYEAEGGTPIVASEGGKLATAAIAGASAREQAIVQQAREYKEAQRLNGTPVTDEVARWNAEAFVDAPDPFAEQAGPTAEEMQAQLDADRTDAEARRASSARYDAERPQRDAAAADHAGKVDENEKHRRLAVTHGSTWEQAAERFPDVPAGPEMLEPTSLAKASADLFDGSDL